MINPLSVSPVRTRVGLGGLVAAGVALVLAVSAPSAASAATTIDGPIGLGTAAAFGVLGASTVTNTGLTVVSGDVGVTPGSAITGFPPGILNSGGVFHVTDTVADQAQLDTTAAYDVAASLSPTSSGLTNLVGPLSPGVYSGDALSISGSLQLAGAAGSVWVFQAASSLITATGSTVSVTGGASICDVFWQVGSSATLGTNSTMVGTVMALASITSNTGTTVQGRLLARTGAVTLDDTTIVPDRACTQVGTVGSSPTITSGTPDDAELGSPFSFRVLSSGTGTPTFAVTDGATPPGLTLDATSGVISGTPTVAGSFPLTVSVSNGIAPPATMTLAIRVNALLAATGSAPGASLPLAVGAVLLGGLLLAVSPATRRRRHRADIVGG